MDERYFKGLEGKYNFDLHFILQEKNAEPGHHIVRARGAWFGNRSISAEVELEAGIYEVLPKIEASQDKEAPDVPAVVAKLAEHNPQKLRQIGLNYDIANAKGVFELTEEERKKKEQKKKEAAEKKKEEEEAKDKERAEFEAWRKEKAEFEVWKKEERAEYEAWKKEEKKRKTEETAKESGKSEEEHQHSSSATKEPGATAGAIKETGQEAEKTTSVDTEGTEKPLINLPIQGKESLKEKELAIEPSLEPRDSSDNGDANHTPTSEVHPHDSESDNPNHSSSTSPEARIVRSQTAIASHYRPPPPSDYRGFPGYAASGPVPPPPPQANPAKELPKPWNAVCVLGLRVYSQDPDVSIKLVKPKDEEEGAILDIDGDTAAGATM